MQNKFPAERRRERERENRTKKLPISHFYVKNNMKEEKEERNE